MCIPTIIIFMSWQNERQEKIIYKLTKYNLSIVPFIDVFHGDHPFCVCCQMEWESHPLERGKGGRERMITGIGMMFEVEPPNEGEL